MDFITELPIIIFRTREVNTILIIINSYTKIYLFFSINSLINIVELVELLYNKIKLKFRALSRIISD